MFRSRVNSWRPQFYYIFLFVLLILGFHFLFRFWAYVIDYWPVKILITPLYQELTNILFKNSIWAISHLTNLDFHVDFELRKIYVLNGYVSVNYACSGLKQFLQWLVLMIFFPGPWKHKSWFIPLGLIIIHLVNVFRISGLAYYLKYNPPQQHWDFAHDYIYRPFFYVVMFALWIFWVEKILSKTKK